MFNKNVVPVFTSTKFKDPEKLRESLDRKMRKKENKRRIKYRREVKSDMVNSL
jgi:hypothetical protein